MIDSIIEQRSKGNPMIALSTETKLVLKGVNPIRFNQTSPDDQYIVARLRAIAAELGVHIASQDSQEPKGKPITAAYSTKDLPEAVADLKRQCGDREPRVALVFGSARYDPLVLSQHARDAFPHACVAGCSTAGEIVAGKMLNGSVVALFLDEEIVEDAAAAVVENLSSDFQVDAAFRKLEQHFKAPISSFDVQKYVGLVLVDGLSRSEERLMDKIGDRADIMFVGGSAGDDLRFQRTYVLHNGQAYSNAAVLVVLRLKRGFEIVKTQSFQPIGRTLVATKVDEPNRKVIEFNHMPALDGYADALGVSADRVHTLFAQHPLGLTVQGEPFVRSPQRVEGRSILFYCQIKKDTDLEVLRATDIVADTRAAIEARRAAPGEIRGMIEFQCILRTLQLRSENRGHLYGEIFCGIPMAGFSTYGEAYLGHINQTSTILLFR